MDNNIELKGLSFQGHGIFKDYYTLFRGKGHIISGTSLYSTLINFFTSKYLLVYEYSENAKEIKEILQFQESGSINGLKVLNIISASPSKRKTAYDIFTEFVSAPSEKPFVTPETFSVKDDVKETADSKYDLAFYRLMESFAPEKPTSLPILKKHIQNLLDITERIMFGGFLVITMPKDNPMLDLVLSSVEAIMGSRNGMVYNGMMFHETLKIPIWIYRKEPYNESVLTARINMAKKRLRRHLAIYEEYVDQSVQPSILNGGRLDEPVLKIKVTPSHELFRLFDMLQTHPREIINAVLPYQPEYTKVLESASTIPSKSTLIHFMNEVLYDFALALGRRHPDASHTH